MTETLTRTNLGGLKVGTVRSAPKFMNALIYGPWGSGKTLLAASSYDVPEMNNIIYVNAEGGLSTLWETYPDVPVLFEEDAPTWADLSQVYFELAKPGHGYKTVIFDSLDEIQKICMGEIMAEMMVAVEKDGNPQNRSIDNPSKREFGIVLERMRRFVRMFRDLKMNVIFIAHSVEFEDEKTKKKEVKPNFVGKMKDEAPSYVDAVFYLGVDARNSGTRVLLTDSNGRIGAKSRSRVLSDLKEIENPVMANLYYELTNTTRSN